jgi:hypothetical protein
LDNKIKEDVVGGTRSTHISEKYVGNNVGLRSLKRREQLQDLDMDGGSY